MKIRVPIYLPSVNRDIGSTTLTGCGKHPQQAEVKQGVVLSNLRPRLTEKAAQAAECKGVEVKRTRVARLAKSQVLYMLQTIPNDV